MRALSTSSVVSKPKSSGLQILRSSSGVNSLKFFSIPSSQIAYDAPRNLFSADSDRTASVLTQVPFVFQGIILPNKKGEIGDSDSTFFIWFEKKIISFPLEPQELLLSSPLSSPSWPSLPSSSWPSFPSFQPGPFLQPLAAGAAGSAFFSSAAKAKETQRENTNAMVQTINFFIYIHLPSYKFYTKGRLAFYNNVYFN